MKIGGRKSIRNLKTVFFPREGSEPIIIKLGAVMDIGEFDKLLPVPKPPMVLRSGETEATPDLSDAGYKQKMAVRGTKLIYWLILKALDATPDLVLETVKLEDPTTWENLEAEFTEFGLTKVEQGKITTSVLQVNSLDDAYLNEAQKRFTATQPAA